MYRLEIGSKEHSQSLRNIQTGWQSCQPDAFLLSEDGNKVYTQRIILCLYSSMCREMMRDSRSSDMVGVSVPVRSSNTVLSFLKVLTEGRVFSSDSKEDLEDVTLVASVLGIELGRMQLGSRKNRTKSQKRDGSLGFEFNKAPNLEESQTDIKFEYTEHEVEPEEIEVNFCEDMGGCESVLDSNATSALLGTENDTLPSEINFSCKICGVQLETQKALNKHINKTHIMKTEDGDNIRYSCLVCEETFSWKLSLNRHLKSHAEVDGQEGESGAVCKICGELSKTRKSLKKHINKTHVIKTENAGIVQYSCNECKKTFSWKITLSRHLKSHTGENQLSCEVCDRKVRDKYQLNQHMLTHSIVSSANVGSLSLREELFLDTNNLNTRNE